MDQFGIFYVIPIHSKIIVKRKMSATCEYVIDKKFGLCERLSICLLYQFDWIEFALHACNSIRNKILVGSPSQNSFSLIIVDIVLSKTLYHMSMGESPKL